MNRTLKIGLSALFTVTTLGTLALAVLSATASCAHTRSCGECYNTGEPGVIVVRKGVQDCDACPKK